MLDSHTQIREELVEDLFLRPGSYYAVLNTTPAPLD